MHQVNMLIVGGNVGLENFRFAKSSPNANVEVVSRFPELVDLINKHDSVMKKNLRKNAQEKAYGYCLHGRS
jgi:hypothetical protein